MFSKLLVLITPELFLGLFKSKKCLFACLAEAALCWAYVDATESTIKIIVISAGALVAVGYMIPQGMVDIVVARQTGKDPDTETVTNVSTSGPVNVTNTSVSPGGMAVVPAAAPASSKEVSNAVRSETESQAAGEA